MNMPPFLTRLYKITYFYTHQFLYRSQIMSNLFSTKNLILKPTNTFDQTLLLKALSTMFIKKILKELEHETTIQYDAEIKKQKQISESSAKHSKEHLIILRNTEKLLRNLTTIKNELKSVSLMDSEIKNHVSAILKLETLELLKKNTFK